MDVWVTGLTKVSDSTTRTVGTMSEPGKFRKKEARDLLTIESPDIPRYRGAPELTQSWDSPTRDGKTGKRQSDGKGHENVSAAHRPASRLMPGQRNNSPPDLASKTASRIRGQKYLLDPLGDPQTPEALRARVAQLRAILGGSESAPPSSRGMRIEDKQALDAGGATVDVEQSSNVEKVGVEPSVDAMDVEPPIHVEMDVEPPIHVEMDVEPPIHVEMDRVESSAHATGEETLEEVDLEVPTRLRSENPGGSSASVNLGRIGAEPKERESTGVQKRNNEVIAISDSGEEFGPSVRRNKVRIRDGFLLALTRSLCSLSAGPRHQATKILWSLERAATNPLPRPPTAL